ncbi:hypothetical protein G9H72_15470, partial [Motilibacter sp. K478]|nr:hypothetical protein [Motilibacter aurantiacus]
MTFARRPLSALAALGVVTALVGSGAAVAADSASSDVAATVAAAADTEL